MQHATLIHEQPGAIEMRPVLCMNDMLEMQS